MIGKTISHYKILEEIGSGGMGVVYKAEDINLDRHVALKFLPPGLTRDNEARERFIHEAKSASALDHPNICTIHEIDKTDDNQMFIAMGYYEGETLKDKIAKGPLKIDEAVDVAIQIATGLEQAHSKNILHRDIKPANIFITEKNVVKILDFGLAKLSGQTKLTKDGSTLGTVAYMSPEQTTGEETDSRSDIWSLSIVLFEMITGLLPFKGDYEQAMQYSIVNQEPDTITGLRSGIPMELERMVNKSLAKSPDERYQHVDEFLADFKNLKRALGKPEKIQHSTIADSKTPRKRHNRILITIGSFVLLFATFFLLRPLLFEKVIQSAPEPIAVLPFENLTGDTTYDILQKSIANLLIAKLEQSKYLQVTTWERLRDLLNQTGVDNIEIVDIDEDMGFELCRKDGINAAVTGSYSKIGNLFAMEVKVLDVSSKEILLSETSSGEGEDSIFRQIDQLTRAISKGIGLSERKIEENQRPIIEVTTNSIDAYNYFIRGREDFEKRYFNQAKQYLEKAINIDTTFAMAYFWLARTNSYLGITNEEKLNFKKAMDFSQQAAEKEKLYIEMYYASHVEFDDEKKTRILKQLARKSPNEKRVHVELGGEYFLKNLYDQALTEFNLAIELDPNFIPAIGGVIQTYIEMKNFEKAIEYLQKYAAASPREADPYVFMGDTYFRMGKIDEALIKYKEALEIKPDFGSELKISYIYALEENYDEAIKWVDQYIANALSSSERAYGLYYKGFYNGWLGNYKKSFNYLDLAIDSYGVVENYWEINNVIALIGWIYLDKGELLQSQESVKKWYDFRKNEAPDHQANYESRYHFWLGLIDLQRGNIDSVKYRLEKIKILIPKISTFLSYVMDRITNYYKLLYSELLLSENLLSKAITFNEEASIWELPYTLISFNVPFDKDVLARIHIKNEEIDKAIIEYEQLINHDPNKRGRFLVYPKYHYRLAMLYEVKGLKQKAIQQYTKFLEIWKNADEDLPEKIDAQKRLANLNRE